MESERKLNIGELLKKHFKLVIGVIIIVIVVMAGILWNGSKKLDVSKDIDPHFSGYSGRGELSYNSDKIDDDISRFLLKKQGIKENIIDGLVKEDSDVEYAVMSDPDLVAKVSKAEEQQKSVTYEFSKTSNLKNDDTVTFTLKNTSEKIPVKEIKKEFKVKGLKKSSTFNLSDLLKEHPVTFTGYDVAGKISDDLKDWYNLPKNNEELHNGDKVDITINPDYVDKMESKGKIFTGDNSKKIEVSGLKSYKDIENLEDVLKQTDDYARSKDKDSSNEFFNESTKYTITRIHSYIAPYTESSWSFSTNEESPESYDSKAQLASIYKVVETDTKDGEVSSEKTAYKIYGYDDLICKDNKINTNKLENHVANYSYSDFEDEQSAISEIKSYASSFQELT
ncbi:hypothetical protein [Enterococcus faecium]|uniref:hypothetical protein n=1 Tax=Enterococcus faecium TaxID=1352 RepID=UPI000BEF9F03|nr:hypothetical protein [Enterococcus faecium]PEH49504.1 hypothetical protein CRM75_01700 [Enterococcus faecium]